MKIPPLIVAFIILTILCILIAALCLQFHHFKATGGAPAQRASNPALSPHIVVDTLNLTHWFAGGKDDIVVSPSLIVETINRTAPVLKLRHSGRVMYVLKDRESQFNDEKSHALYKEAATRNGVYIYTAEKYVDPPAGVKNSSEHSARGRDDFFVALLAYRWRCAVLTEDRLRDFDRFRATIPPFHVYEFAFWRDLPVREFVRPDSPVYMRMKKPKMVRFTGYFDRKT